MSMKYKTAPLTDTMTALDPSTLNKRHPSSFYLLSDDYERLADAVFVAQGVSLPVHSQVVSQHSPILRSMFVSQLGQATDNKPVRLEGPWKDYIVIEVACFLWLAYHPAAINSENVARLGDELQGVLCLADQLEVSAIVEAICQHLERSDGNSLEQLIPLLAITERLHLSNTWAALMLKLAHVLQDDANGHGAAVTGPQLLQVKDQLSPTAWATLVACLLPARNATYGYGYGRSSMPGREQVAGWLDGKGTVTKRPSAAGDERGKKKVKAGRY